MPSLWGAAVHILAAVLSRGLAGALMNRTGGTVWGDAFFSVLIPITVTSSLQYIRVLLFIFISELDDGAECIFRKFAVDIKL